jgi:hypothetical protein
MSAFDGTQPVFRQSPPSKCRSTSATRAPRPAAPITLTRPAVPAADHHQVVGCGGRRIAPRRWVGVLDKRPVRGIIRWDLDIHSDLHHSEDCIILTA